MRCDHWGMTHLQTAVARFQHILERMDIAHPREGNE